jgi:hypothetical protein
MPLSVQKLIAIFAYPGLAAALNDADPNARMFAASLADNHQIRNVNRGFLWQDSALHILLWIGLSMLLDIINTLDHSPILIQVNLEHFACFAPVFPGQHVNHVVFLYMHSGHRILSLSTAAKALQAPAKRSLKSPYPAIHD